MNGAVARRPGFVLPLALLMLTIIALLAALLLQASIEDLRVARGEVAAARAQAMTESAMADMLAGTPDSAALALPRGTLTTTVTTAGADTTRVATQSLGAGIVRITVGARAWSDGVRADVSNVGFFHIVPGMAGSPGSLRYQRLPGWWWAQIP
jgi:Tfp pilus assembly protein PilX